MPEPLIVNASLAQRIDIAAASKPQVVKRSMWFFGILEVWSAIGMISSLAASNWAVAAITFATTALSGLMWLLLRRSVRRIPATTRWIEELSEERRG